MLLNHLIELSSLSFYEQPLRILLPTDFGHNLVGLHTFNCHDGYIVIDAKESDERTTVIQTSENEEMSYVMRTKRTFLLPVSPV